MQFDKEIVIANYFLNTSHGKVSAHELRSFIREFHLLSEAEQQEFASQAAIEMGLPQCHWSWSPYVQSTEWDPSEIKQLKLSVGDAMCQRHLVNFRDNRSPKVRVIAGMMLLDIAWTDHAEVSVEMLSQINAAILHYHHHETDANVRKFLRQHLVNLRASSKNHAKRRPLDHFQPSRN